MKKGLIMLACVVTFFAATAVSAGAVVNETVKVGLRFGSSALFSANLENAVGEGYEFGWFDEQREFQSLGWTEETAISMTAAGTIYVDDSGNYSSGSGGDRMGPWHIQLDARYEDYDEAADAAAETDGWPAWIDGEYAVRLGCYESKSEAEEAASDLGVDGMAVKSSSDGILVTRTRTRKILFEFDWGGEESLGVLPQARRQEALTWFKGYKYKGGFEYVRPDGGNLRVINVVGLEDYVKGVVPYEMNGDWPLAALEAQAVCARTFACRTTKHMSLYGFDVCAGTDCQVYNGVNTATELSDEAVDNTAGECLYYDGELIEAVYHSSNGGATEDAENVWGGDVPYLQGKEDPYEADIAIPNYRWSVTYTADQLTWILQQKNYSIGRVEDVYVSAYTAQGNVAAVTFADSGGKTLTVKGDTARGIFYSSTYGKSVRSMRFDINGGSGGFYVNGTSGRLDTLLGAAVIAAGGAKSTLPEGGWYAVTADGEVQLSGTGGKSSASGDSFTITGMGSGHNVGLSQYGARAMAENGCNYEEILEFYYTDITIE